MKKMRSGILALTFICLCLVSSSLPTIQATPVVPEDVVLPLGEDFSITMSKLLEHAGDILEISILYNESEVSDVRFLFTHNMAIPKDKFQGFFERLLLEKEFLFYSSGAGPDAIHRVSRINQSSRMNPMTVNSAVLVPLEQIEDYKNRGVLVTIHIPLKNLHVRTMVQSLNPYFMHNAMIESVRAVDSGNILIMTAVAPKAWRLVKMIQKMDAVAEESRSSLEDRIKKLEKRLKALESKKESGK